MYKVAYLLGFDFHLRGACVGDEPEERSPFLDEVSEKFWNEVSERFENAGEGRVEGEIDADLLIEGGCLLGGGGAEEELKEEVSFASAQVFPAPAREEKEVSLLLYSCNSSSKPTSSLQLFVLMGTAELPLLRLLDNSSPLLLLPPFFFRLPVVWLETLMVGREEGLW